VTSGEIAMAFANGGAAGVEVGTADDLHIEFMTALLTPPAIGGNLFGLLKLGNYKRQLPRRPSDLCRLQRATLDPKVLPMCSE